MSNTTSTRRWTKTMLRLALFAVVVGQAFSGHAAEKIPAGLTLESLEINPARVELQQKSDVAQLLITGWLESGEQIDVTRMVKLVDQPAFVKVTEQRAIRPLADGQQKLISGALETLACLRRQDLFSESSLTLSKLRRRRDTSFFW